MLFSLAINTLPLCAATSSAGGGALIDNKQAVQGIQYLIRYQGTAPTDSSIVAGGAAPVGEIRMFAGDYTPGGGWRPCDGSLVSVTDPDYAALFALIGYTYGGDGVTVFALPDLRGRVIAGTGTRALGTAFGTETLSLGSSHLPAHHHTRPSGGVTGVTGAGAPFNTEQRTLALRHLLPKTGATDYLSEVRIFGGPTEFTNCPDLTGQSLDRVVDNALFSKLGTAYGALDTQHFNLPDLRDSLTRAFGNGRVLGEKFGSAMVSLVGANLPSHAHTVYAGPTAATGQVFATPFENSQPTLAMNYIICIAGEFPSEGNALFGAANASLGEIRLMAGSSLPPGWAAAAGQILPINQNIALFFILGTTYGGNGTTNFALPNLRANVPVGPGTDGIAPAIALGQSAGMDSTLMSEVNMPAHTHGLDTFASLHPGLDKAADDNQNGQSNFEDYARGLDPTGPDDPSGHATVVWSPGGTFLTSTYRVDADDVFINWSYSTDLVGWFPLTISEDDVEVLSPTRIQFSFLADVEDPPGGAMFFKEELATAPLP